MSTPPPYLTIAQVAERLQVDRQTVSKAIRLGKLEAVRVFRHWRISEAALSEYLVSCTPVVQIRNRRRSA